ncbi:MAG: TonB-dependent receptor [Pseudomonadota bacterium]
MTIEIRQWRGHGLAVALLATAAMRPSLVWAQTADVLPPVIIDGASLAKPKAKPSYQGAQEKEAEPEPAAKAEKKPKPAPGGEVGSPASDGAGDVAGSAAPDEVTSGVPADRIGTSVSVVTRADLEARQIRHAADALRSLPGVHVGTQGTRSNVSVVRIRGAESNHTLVLIDGVEVNSSGGDGFFDFSLLTTDDIERIEVLRGPQSGLYGSGAIGGVVNIITKAGKGPPTIRAFAEAGSFGTLAGAVQASGGSDRAHGAITLSGRRFDGFNISRFGEEDDGGRISTFSVGGGVMVVDGLKVEGTLRMANNTGERDAFGGLDGSLLIPSDDRSEFDTRLWVGRLQATLDMFGGHWQHKVFVNRAETDSEDRDELFGSTRTRSTNLKYGYLSTVRLDTPGFAAVRHYVTGLVEQEEEGFVQPTFDADDHRRDRTSIAGEVRGEYFDTLFLAGTVRQDNNSDVDDYTTWRVSGALKVPETPFRLHASYGTGVKYASFSEQLGFFFGFVPNPDLVPEESEGWDAGIETRLFGGRALVDVTYFDTTLENEIDTKFVPPGVFTAFNRDGESRRKGIEVASRLALGYGLSLGLSYTWLDATEETGEQEIRRPPHSGRVDVNYAFAGGRGNFNLAAAYNGEMNDIAFDALTFSQVKVDLDEYWLVTAAASYKVLDGVELFGRVENLFDAKYEEVFGYETAGIAAYAGVRLTYGGEPVRPAMK